ncbi:hypothetical protein [Microbacterium binotii]|uniref:hypothetical protein n=1 Tax=Microbacterium binotii TaxID=462710 RepID=UPI001F1595EF|nr:hypothetical protein [Microbacterium binotii]UIN31293.1 hypothetical protein LXM64_03555 [Microbacterium binotii]
MDRFMGVDPEGLTAVGRIVVAAGRVEMVLALVASELGLPNPLRAAGDVVKDTRRAARKSDPLLAPHSDLVLGWLAKIRAPLEVRHRAVHGVHLTDFSPDGDRAPVQWLMRSGERMKVDVAEFNETAETLARLNTEGMNLFGVLHAANFRRSRRVDLRPE